MCAACDLGKKISADRSLEDRRNIPYHAPEIIAMGHDHLFCTNLIGVSTPYFASPAFNLSPVPIHIHGVREMKVVEKYAGFR